MASLLFDTNQLPQNEEEFVKWMESKFEIRNALAKGNYESNAVRLLELFQISPFWKRVDSLQREWDAEYYRQNGVHLFTTNNMPKVVYKPYESLLNKAYRKNCLKNKSFPDQPEKGWVNPMTWFDQIHDIIRTSFVVRYLDGVKFLEQKLMQVSSEVGCKYDCSYEAHDDGYYAAHIAVVIDMPLLGLDWEETIHQIEIEIQITTELQSMVKELLHKYYEDNRRKIIPEDYKWQWDYNSEQFVPNYLGHVAHYLEGVIVEIRDKQNLK